MTKLLLPLTLKQAVLLDKAFSTDSTILHNNALEEVKKRLGAMVNDYAETIKELSHGK